MKASDNPFGVLGLPPTLDPARIKRAYFAALAKTPPHQDGDGFRKLRKAYEQLTQPGSLALAFLRASGDPATDIAQWEGRFLTRVNEAREASQATRLASRATEEFIGRVSRMRWDDVIGR